MLHLRPYQTNAISDLRESFKNGHRRIILALPTGAGKTVVFSEMVRMAADKGTRTLILTDRIELFEQTFKALQRHSIPIQIVNANTASIDQRAIVTVAMIETIHRRGYNVEPDLIIIDECFTSDTMIDGKKISEIKIGDYVYSFNHENGIVEKNVVKNIFKNKFNEGDVLIKINYLCGSIRCTKEHPIYIKNKGYVKANEVCEGDEIFLLNMRNGDIKGECFSIKMEQGEIFKWCYNLLERMYFYFQVKKVIRKKSNDGFGCEDKNVGHAKENRTQAINSWWKWEGANSATKNIIRKIGRRVVCRIGNCNRKWLSTISLQNRYWKPNKENSNRNRWDFSRFIKSKKSRCEKNNHIESKRVQSIEVLKFGNNGEFGDGYKYNFEVENNNNYFANGILVHNCHKNSFSKLIDTHPTARVIGATATPVGKHIPKYYSEIIQTIDTPDLVNQGYLCECKAFQMVDDFSDLKIKGKEYTDESLFNHFNKRKLYSGVVTEWQKRTPNKKTIVFNVNIEHSDAMAAEFNSNGIVSESITSKTPKAERTRILEAFSKGLFPVLNNCGILTTGYDEPSIECVIMNRKTLSLPLFLQCLGRGSRPYQIKTHFTVLDFGMNHDQHGMWNEPREWSLKEKKKKKEGAAPVKTCPKCEAMLYATAKVCKFCGLVFEQKEAPVIEGVMVEVVPKKFIGKKFTQLTLTELVELQKTKKYKASYIWRVVRSKGREALTEYASLMAYSSGWIYRQEALLGDTKFNDYAIRG